MPRLNLTRFTYPSETEGSVDFGGRIYNDMVYLFADNHPSSSNHLIATRLGVEPTISLIVSRMTLVLTVTQPNHRI